MKYKIIIPARYNSTRLPGKPLKKIGGIPLVIKTAMNCTNVFDKSLIVICTDDERIRYECEKYSFKWSMTSSKCLTGMDRVSEFALKDDASYYVNVQGDEPFIHKNDLLAVKKLLDNQLVDTFNCYTQIDNLEDFLSSSIPKIVKSSSGKLMYISRGPIPSSKTHNSTYGNKQVCIYGLHRDILTKYYGLNSKKTYNEEIEDIEIIRLLDNDIAVNMVKLSHPSFSIDTKDDLNRANDVN